MGIHDIVEHEYGEIGFCGTIRGGDERGHSVFRIRLSHGEEYFGEFRNKFYANGNDYMMDIVSFGYKRELSTGAPHPEARTPFGAEDVGKIITMIRFLFTSKEAEFARNGLSNFAVGKYLGDVHFLKDWIRTK